MEVSGDHSTLLSSRGFLTIQLEMLRWQLTKESRIREDIGVRYVQGCV